MTIGFFNVLWVYFLEKCLFGLRLDTSKLPFSIMARFIPFYTYDFWINKTVEYQSESGQFIKRIDLLLPFICDISLYY